MTEKEAGFRAGYSTADHIFTLISIIQKGKAQRKGNVFVVFVDLYQNLRYGSRNVDH